MLNVRTSYAVYATDGSIDPATSRKYFWLNADYPNKVEAYAAAIRVLQNAEGGANEVEVRTVTNIQKGV